MTNRQKMETLTTEDYYDVMLHLITSYQCQSTLSRQFMIEWLQDTYYKDDWAWNPVNYTAL